MVLRGLSSTVADQVLTQVLADSTRRAVEISPSFAQLWAEIERLTQGGKRFRPALVALTAQAYAQADTGASAAITRNGAGRTVATVGAAFELLHSALIIHDDVIDRDPRRRHGPTLHQAARDRAVAGGTTVERADHYGYSVGIIAGDLALAAAHRVTATAGLSREKLNRVLDLLDYAVFASAAGELMDIDHALPGARPSVEAVLEATRLKTSVYSFEAPLQAGAVIAGAPEAHIQALREIGRNLGLAFQLADDLLGVFGSDQQTGKPTDGDLREGKHTLLIAEAAGQVNADDVLALVGRHDLTAEEAARIREHLEAGGARSAVEQQARAAAARAVEVAESAQLPEGLTGALAAVAQDAVERIR